MVNTCPIFCQEHLRAEFLEVLRKNIRVCHCVGGMMGSSAQIGLHADCLAWEELERGRLPGFEGILLQWGRAKDRGGDFWSLRADTNGMIRISLAEA